ncbi:MAG: pantoate--beta-alanine ligase [Gemmataceae bacterium]|nr:pantoate--beta-alanine ligase [Gemmataceae bacterium]
MSPLITTAVAATREAIAQAKGRGLRVGFVPTMGALHEGHASLIRAARAECGFVVVSIFVNPAQFGPTEDLARYPRPFEKDVMLCANEGVALVFHPNPTVIYPPGYKTVVEVRELQEVLCGASRPGHFGGVATVVLKLFNIVQPDLAYFGQKDAQQARLLEQMVLDLNLPVTMRICPIIREEDGLALSSRNVYLSAEERKHATVLYRALEEMRQRVASGERSAAALVRIAADLVAGTPGARLDYASIVDWQTLRPLDVLSGQVLVALAVYFGATRLIDNVLLEVKD